MVVAPPSPVTIRGAGTCSPGNQSGGVALPVILAASYSLLLPGTRTGPVAGTLGGWTLSGMLYAQEGRPLGIDSGAWAVTTEASSEAKGKTLIQLVINIAEEHEKGSIRNEYTPGGSVLLFHPKLSKSSCSRHASPQLNVMALVWSQIVRSWSANGAPPLRRHMRAYRGAPSHVWLGRSRSRERRHL